MDIRKYRMVGNAICPHPLTGQIIADIEQHVIIT
jgi:hypothetical protein